MKPEREREREREREDLVVNKENSFEIIIKAPNNLFDELNKKMDLIINRLNGIL